MNNENQTREIYIERKPSVLRRTGFSKSTLHNRISQGLFVPPITLGGRAVGFPGHEVDYLIYAMIAEHSLEDIKILVVALLEKRKSEPFAELLV